MKIGIAGWSFVRRFKSGALKMVDYPDLAKKEFGVDGIELNSPFFDSMETSYLNDLRARADNCGVKLLHISIDGHGNLAALDESERKESVERHMPWFDACRILGCESFRANSGGHPDGTTENVLRAAVKSFSELSEEGAKAGIKVLIENHGGVSAEADNVVAIMKAVDSEWVGTCPDFGNFRPWLRYQGLRKIYPYAHIVHAKVREFDEATGEAADIDVGHCIELARDAVFDGYMAVEFEGKADDFEGVHKSIDLLKKYL